MNHFYVLRTKRAVNMRELSSFLKGFQLPDIIEEWAFKVITELLDIVGQQIFVCFDYLFKWKAHKYFHQLILCFYTF